jgi:hypothetical protein
MTLTFVQQTSQFAIGAAQSPFLVGQTITTTGFSPSTLNGTYVVTTAGLTSVSFALTNNPGTISVNGIVKHLASLSVNGVISVNGNANIGNITGVSSINGSVISLSGSATQQQLLSAGLIRMGGNHAISGTHTVGGGGITVQTGTPTSFLNPGLTLTFALTQSVAPFVPGQKIMLVNGSTSWNQSIAGLTLNTDYIVTECTNTYVKFGAVTSYTQTSPTQYGTSPVTVTGGSLITGTSGTITTSGVIITSPNNTIMNVNGSANFAGTINIYNPTSGTNTANIYANGDMQGNTFTATLFSGNGASITNIDYNKISTNKPNFNVTTATQAAGGGAFSYSTTTGFNFTPAASASYTAQTLTPSGTGSLVLIGTAFQYTPPVIPSAYVLPAATTTSLGGVIVSTGLSVSGGYITNNGVTSITNGGNITVTNVAGGATTISIPQSVATTASVQFDSTRLGSLGVGRASTGVSGEIYASGQIYSDNNITAYNSSDRKFKENITPITNALKIVLGVGGKLYDWTDEYLDAQGGEDDYFRKKADFGVIAQDLIDAGFGIAVRTRKDGSLAVDYQKLVALAFQAIIEQETNHKEEMQSLQRQIDTIMEFIKG